jgi:hypothetical protein
MSHYTVSNSKGAFTREDMTGEQTDTTTTQNPGAKPDTTQVQPSLRPQLQKHRRNGK